MRRSRTPAIALSAVLCAHVCFAQESPDVRPRGAAEPPRVALIVVGADASPSGALTRTLEARLAGLPQLRLRNSEQAVALLSPGAAEIAASDPLGTRVSEKLPLIARAFYEDKLKEAEALLAAAEAARARSSLAKLKLLLWKAAILEAKGDKPGAEAAAKEAIALAPDVEADGRIHPPALQELLSRVKPKIGRSASLAVLAFPPGAVVRIDDRLAEGRVAVTPGKHLVVVTSRGYRPVEATVNVTADATTTISLPVSYGAAEPALTAYAEGGADAPIAELARKLEVETAVVVATDPGKELRVQVWGRMLAPAPKTSFANDAAGQAALADWIEARFKPEIARAPDLREWTWVATGGPVFAARQRRLAAEGDGFAASFGGAGPALALRAAPGRWRIELDASAVTYSFGKFEASFPDGSSARVGGGTTTSVRAGGAFAFGSGKTGREDRAEIAPLLAVSWEKHDADDVSDERGTLGFLPSHERVALAAGAQAGFPLGRMGAGPLRLVARAAVVPVSTHRESPYGSSGRRPGTDPGFEGLVGATWEPGRWILAAQMEGEYRTVRFHGDADLPADPALRSTRLREGVQLFTITFGRAF